MSEFPSWHDLPLRLNNFQIDNPHIVFKEFFENFHLKDARSDFFDLYDLSTGQESDKAKSNFFIYVEVEKLIEAAWVIVNNIRKNNGEKYKLLEPVAAEILGKKATEIERARYEPTKVIFDIYEQYSLTDLRDCLINWAIVATSEECNAYDDADSRKQLNLLVGDLNSYFEALYVINSQINNQVNKTKADKINDLSRDQILNPQEVLSSFFNKFPITYLRRELFDWLQASISFTQPWPKNFHEGRVCGTYKIFSCLIEAGWMLAQNN
jgi:hypothetical protein